MTTTDLAVDFRTVDNLKAGVRKRASYVGREDFYELVIESAEHRIQISITPAQHQLLISNINPPTPDSYPQPHPELPT